MRRSFSAIPLLAMLASLTYCAAPPPPPAPAPPPPPPKTPPPAPAADWRDAPLTPGVWRYQPGPNGGGTVFGAPRPELQQGPPFTLRCIRDRRTIEFSTPGMIQSNSVRFRTSFGEFDAAIGNSGGEHPIAIGSIPAYSPSLDQLAYTRGRFMLTRPGLEALIIPAWPEIARVIEDCRE